MGAKLGSSLSYLRQGSVSLRRLVPGSGRTMTQAVTIPALIHAAAREPISERQSIGSQTDVAPLVIYAKERCIGGFSMSLKSATPRCPPQTP